ncbi:MAG: Cobalamin-binding protein precursor [Candidatus Methanolliviera sp. GoM_asphalt]|nr:MAG: Cobalamin-binding protein precursor [Candidatus Methanolliviera sp. GoM_asphalt]
MNKKIFVGAMLVCLIVCVAFPVSQAGAQKTVTVVDSVGNKIEVPYPVERVASLNPAALEVIRALGAKDRIVGIDQFTKWNPDFYPRIKDKPSIGMPMGMPPNYEKIIDLNPQVVISYADPMWYYPDLENKLKPAGIKVVRLDLYKPKSFEHDVKALGKMLGKDKEAKEFLDFTSSYVDKIEGRIKDIPAEERVKIYSEFFMPYVAYSRGSGVDHLIEMAGGVNVFSGGRGRLLKMPGYLPGKSGVYLMVNPEAIVEKNPQVMIKDYMGMADYMSMGKKPKTVGYTGRPDAGGMKQARDEMMNRPGFGGIDAVKNGNVHAFAFGELATSPRWPVALGYMAKWSYPDRFKDLDPEAFHKEWLKKWYGLEYKGIYVYP